MDKVYIYYESKNIKNNETTTLLIKVFKNWEKAKKYMDERREELISKYGLVPDRIDELGDKTWTRLYKNKQENCYIDLIIEEKELI